MIDNLLLSIGAMKAGTTWLYSHLDKHPDIYFAREKEIHFFSHVNKKFELSNQLRIRNLTNAVNGLKDTSNLLQARKTVAWYYMYLNPNVTESWYYNLFRDHGDEKYFADFSNTYAFLDNEGWDAVRRVSENVRVLYTLRDPAKRLWSHIKFHAKFTSIQASFNEWGASDFQAFLDSNQHLLRPGEYSKTIQVLRRKLIPDEYLLLFLDDIESSPETSLHTIESFLGISHINRDSEALKKRVNTTENNAVPEPLLAVASGLLAEELQSLTDLGINFPESWHQSLNTTQM